MLVIVIAPSMVQMHTAPRVVDIVSYLKVCHEKWSPATVLVIKKKKKKKKKKYYTDYVGSGDGKNFPPYLALSYLTFSTLKK